MKPCGRRGVIFGAMGSSWDHFGIVPKGMLDAMFGPWGYLFAQGGVEQRTSRFELRSGQDIMPVVRGRRV